MPVITKISQQKNNEERYNIFLDEKYSFSVDESLIVQYGLTKGKVLEQIDIEEMAFDDEIQKAFNRALNFLSYQMRSEHEVRKKLRDAEFGEMVIEESIQKLYKLGFLNDEQFTEALVSTKRKTANKGPIAIRQDLQKKGIEPSLMNKVLDTFSEEEQVEAALLLAERIVMREESKTPRQVKQKIQDTLARKGYPFSIIKQVLDQLTIEREDNEWQKIMGDQGEKAWKKYAAKYSGYDLKMRVKQTLYQKGFPSEVIDLFIEEKEQEDE